MPSVAVPEVSNDTVMSEPEIIELVAVKVIDDPEFSAILDALAANVIVGAASLSTIVTVWVLNVVLQKVLSPPLGVRLILMVSFISDIESSIVEIEKDVFDPFAFIIS